MRINICMSTDENYVNYMATAIVSILKNANISDELHFYILCNKISEKSKKYLRTLNKFKDFYIEFFDIDINDFKHFPAGGAHISNTTYFRYKIAEMLPELDKIIYLDCDIIAKQSLADLFNTDISNYYLGGIEDVGYYYWRFFNPEKYIHIESFYINAGMLLINMKAWRDNNLYKKLIDYTNKEANNIKIGDQDVINCVCARQIKKLDYKWNVQDSFYRKLEPSLNHNKKQIFDAAKNPAIIHYTSKFKPWNTITISKAFDWFYYDCVRRFNKFTFIRCIFLYLLLHLKLFWTKLIKTIWIHNYIRL